MGRNNQQRRAAKKRQRRRAARARERRRRDGAGRVRAGSPNGDRSGRGPEAGPRPATEQLLDAAVGLWGLDGGHFERAVAALSARADEAVVAVERALTEGVDDLWGRGWNPADLVQATTRRLSATHAALAAALAVADARSRTVRGERLHPRWEAQLAGLAERADVRDAAGLDAAELRLGVELLCLLVRLDDVPPTVAPPGDDGVAATAPAGLDERVLARVRALLAKAESTTFDEEAEALTAKAQELIARHAVDEALLHADDDDVGTPSVRRIPVDPPYADAKALLLSVVADANRCRLVYSADYGWATVFGYDGDVDAVELLSSSLMAQATGAMARHGSRRDATGRSRTRSFRRSFLLGFAGRIGERLRETTDAQVAAADASRLLPVLAAREDRLDGAVEDAFPTLEHRASSIGHAAGFVAGRAAAELADLDVTAGALHDSEPR